MNGPMNELIHSEIWPLLAPPMWVCLTPVSPGKPGESASAQSKGAIIKQA